MIARRRSCSRQPSSLPRGAGGFVLLVSSLLLALSPLSLSAGDAPKRIENPWKALPVGTILEFKTVTDESESLHRQSTHAETTEIWTVVANDGKVATIEVATGNAKHRLERDLSPVDPLPEPPPPPAPGATGQPTAFGAPDGQDRTVVAYDQIETPFGTFEGVRIDHRMVMLEAESQGSEWRAPGFPEPLKVVSVHAGGAGVVRTVNQTRTLVRFEVPGSSWRDYALGTSFDVQVEREQRTLYPPGQKPTIHNTTEHWVLVKKDETGAVFAVTAEGNKVEKTLPLVMAPVPANGTTSEGPEEHRSIQVSRETIETPLGKLDCLRIRRLHSMNEAGGADVEWRALGFPIAVKTRSEWAHKQQQEIETRTVVRFAGNNILD